MLFEVLLYLPKWVEKSFPHKNMHMNVYKACHYKFVQTHVYHPHVKPRALGDNEVSV